MYQVEAVSGWRLGTHFGFQPQEPEADGRNGDSREANALVAITRHPK
jgi:hypothetical protein